MSQNFPREIEIYIDRAEKQPIPYLKILTKKISKRGLAHPRVIRLFLKQFAGPIPSANEFVELIAPALLGLSLAIRDADQNELNFIERMILQAWDTIWPWIRVACGKYESPGCEPETVYMVERGLHWSSGDLLAFLIKRSDTIATTVAETPGMLAMSLRMYFTMARRYLPGVDPHCAVSIATVTAFLLKHPSTNFRDMAHVIGTRRKNTARGLVAPLALIRDHPKEWYICMEPFIQVLTSLYLRKPTFYDPLPVDIIMNGICDVATVALSQLEWTSRSQNIVSTHLHELNLTALLKFVLHYASITAHDYLWILSVLRRGFLNTVMDIATYSADPTITALLGFMLDHFAMYSMYRTVLRELKKDVSFKTNMEERKVSESIRMRWHDLRRAMEYSEAAYAEFDALELQSRRCQSSSCSADPASLKLRRCTRCKYVFYCSTSCQKVDWRRHRRSCPTQPSRDHLSSPRAIKFLEYLVEREILARSNQLTTKRDEFLKDPDVNLPLVLLVDFTQRIPPLVDVWENKEFVDDWYRNRDDVDQQKRPLLAPFIELRSGAKMRPISISNEFSGKRFGWLDERAGRSTTDLGPISYI